MPMSKKDWLYFAMFAAIITAGTLITKIGTRKRAEAAERAYREAAARSGASSRVKVNVRYRNGAEKKNDETPTADPLRRAAENGDAQAQFDLAMRYRSGLGVEKDEKQASEWLRKAAAQGHAEAQKALGEPKH